MLGKKFNGAIARPMLPFYVSGLVILYGVNSFANTLAATDEYKDDPRSPAFKAKNAAAAH
ncbi:mitochondrial F1F0 ATP synthase-like protein subunit Atp18 [Sporormia fimetaria CBS 119925]|uniref:Mitochondrial F1F0 ATP synthase-like protein subunit Atp18 n=1 Tax=Sporormia fimetaria CBS 119925 TaxID=1340428 RepID=A0A6A6VEL8_9PLEO|nr:mitochondrial F1F0 ATP synthase-like protein subunit Atp18 [Sporormia fimetaria CBS 119925]